jgi:hypothetical protein
VPLHTHPQSRVCTCVGICGYLWVSVALIKSRPFPTNPPSISPSLRFSPMRTETPPTANHRSITHRSITHRSLSISVSISTSTTHLSPCRPCHCCECSHLLKAVIGNAPQQHSGENMAVSQVVVSPIDEPRTDVEIMGGRSSILDASRAVERPITADIALVLQHTASLPRASPVAGAASQADTVDTSWVLPL